MCLGRLIGVGMWAKGVCLGCGGGCVCVGLMCLGRLIGVGLWAVLLSLDLSHTLSPSLGMWRIDNIVVGGRLSLSLSLSLSVSVSLWVVL
jgi:hypothetical protein